MKLLLDANLSWRLVKKLQADFPESFHVNQTGLAQPASDSIIWEYAKKQGLIIVTNDEDYLRLSLSNGFPPKVVLLRMGNQSTEFTFSTLLNKKAVIEKLFTSESVGIIEIY